MTSKVQEVSAVSERVAPARVHKEVQWKQISLNVLVAFLAAATVVSIVTNQNLKWHVVGEYMFSPTIMRGLGMTLLLTAISTVIGYGLGTVIAFFLLSPVRVLQLLGTGYIWIFRAVPQMVQLLLWFNIAAVIPNIALGVPFGPELFSFSTRGLMTAFVAAVIGLSLAEAAYAAEVVRAGILSVDSGQKAAGEALGMYKHKIFSRIVLPQAMRAILPPVGNSVIGMLKSTSLVSFIAVNDLLHSAQLIYNRTFDVIPLLIVASVWYILVTTVLMFFQSRVERHFGRGYQKISDSQRPGDVVEPANEGIPKLPAGRKEG